MSMNELENKVSQLRELKRMQDELAVEIAAAEDSLKAYILLFGTLPTAFAAEVSGDSTTATEETVSETTSEAAASPAPEESTDISQPPPDETGKLSPSTEEIDSTVATNSTELNSMEEATVPVEEPPAGNDLE